MVFMIFMILNFLFITKGMFFEFEQTDPPCTSNNLNKFKIEPICTLLDSILYNKENFLRLMKYVKQSPIYLGEHELFLSPTNGYILKKRYMVKIIKTFSNKKHLLALIFQVSPNWTTSRRMFYDRKV